MKKVSEQSKKLEESHSQKCPRAHSEDGAQTGRHPLAASAATISISAFGGGVSIYHCSFIMDDRVSEDFLYKFTKYKFIEA